MMLAKAVTTEGTATSFYSLLSTSLQESNMVGLRAANMRRWKDVRKRWRDASLVNRQRYAASLNILRTLYVSPEVPCLEQQTMIP